MFAKNTYLNPQVPPSLHPRPVDLNGGGGGGVEFLLHHHHHPEMFSGHYYLSANEAATTVAAALLNPDSGGGASAVANAFPKKQAAKKDRHSKIYTAQGPRDRRVRLSIGIARKFFDLQEMLGFDKPSKTLDWLLTKSKAAIKELTQAKQNACTSAKSCSSPPSACDELLYFENDGAECKRKSVVVSRDKLGGKDSASKESRAKARARARERTREKMCIKQLSGERNNNGSGFFQSSAGCSSNDIVSKANNAGFRESTLHFPQTDEGDLIQESSIVIKRKAKSPSFFGFQQNFIVSRDLNSNCVIPSPNYASAENWDVCSFTSQSNLYAILDQHKFINSNSNI